jgi:DNA-binding NarL/FixJ family response regulator
MRVLVVDDVLISQAALADILARQPGITAVRTARDALTAARLLAEHPPSVVLVSMVMRDSVTVLRRLGATVPVIAVAVHEADVVVCAESGASGFLLRDESLGDLLALIDSLVRGEMRYSPRVAATLLRRVVTVASGFSPDTGAARLTRREREVIELIEQGLSNKQIARRLSIELRTAKNHVHHILEKYQVHRRDDAVVRFRAAARLG